MMTTILSFAAPLVLLIDFLAIVIFLWLLWRYPVRWAAAFLGIKLITAVITALITVNWFFGAFGPGVLLSFLALLAAPLALLVLAALRPRFWRKFAADPARRRLYLLGGLLVVALQLSPCLGPVMIKSACSSLNQQSSLGLIDALNTYRQAHGRYPEQIDALAPAYLPYLPQPACAALHGGEPPRYRLGQCGQTPVLLNPTVDGMGYDRYNLDTGQWERLGSFLDGECVGLE